MAEAMHCPQCRAGARLAFEVADFNRRIGKERFDYFRCEQCGLVFLGNVPADLARYYPSDYYFLARSMEELAAWAASEQYKIDLIRRFRTGGRLVEVGPASGSFSYLAKTAGFQVAAIEMDRACSEFLSRNLGIEVINSADEAAALETLAPADVIAMWHVIEHLVDPWTMIEVAARKLLPGGVLVLAAPNPHAFQFRVLGRRWVHIDAPRHLWLIPPEVLAARAARLGLKTSLLTTRDAGSLGWNGFGWEYTLMNLFESRLARRAAARLGRAIGAALHPVESREGRGAAYTIVLQKPGA